MKTPISRNTQSTENGFSLTEVTIAIGIVAFGLVVLFGLLPTGLNVVRESTDESVAVNILSAVASDINGTERSLDESPKFEIPTKTETETTGTVYFDEHGNELGSQNDAIYQLTWTARPRDTDSHSPPNILLQVAWSAQADNPSGLVESLIVLPSHE